MFAAGGLLLVASGCASLAAPPHRPRATSLPRRAAHAVGWLAGAFLIGQFLVLPLVAAVTVTHSIRLPVDNYALAVPHSTVSIPAPDGGRSRRGMSHRATGRPSSSCTGRAATARTSPVRQRWSPSTATACCVLDLPGHGASDGHANLLGANAQPAIAAAVDWLARRRGIRPDRIAGFGMSLGGEVLLEAAARDRRLSAVIADGAERASDDRVLHVDAGLARVAGAAANQAIRAVSGCARRHRSCVCSRASPPAQSS